MRRSRIGPGRRSIDRGSTFAKPTSKPVRANASAAPTGGRLAFTAASPAQRAKVNARGSIVSGQRPCDPAHLWPRSKGGCDEPDCVIALTREEHRAFDEGRLDILPALIAGDCWAELAHLIQAHRINPITLVHHLTGERWHQSPPTYH